MSLKPNSPRDRMQWQRAKQTNSQSSGTPGFVHGHRFAELLFALIPAVGLAVFTGILYLLGISYQAGYLTKFGLTYRHFPLPADQVLFNGSFGFAVFSIQASRYFLLAVVVAAMVVVVGAAFLSSHRFRACMFTVVLWPFRFLWRCLRDFFAWLLAALRGRAVSRIVGAKPFGIGAWLLSLCQRVASCVRWLMCSIWDYVAMESSKPEYPCGNHDEQLSRWNDFAEASSKVVSQLLVVMLFCVAVSVSLLGAALGAHKEGSEQAQHDMSAFQSGMGPWVDMALANGGAPVRRLFVACNEHQCAYWTGSETHVLNKGTPAELRYQGPG